MNILLEEFQKEINELREHIFYIKNIKGSVKQESEFISYLSSTTEKKFNYKSLIISLYGIIEYFSENFLKKYLEELTQVVPEYEKLDSKIKEGHIRNTANLALKIGSGYHKYRSISADDIIHNLSGCLNNQQPYTMNYEAFTLLSGNLKHSKICELFGQVDVDINQEFTELGSFPNIDSENKYHKIDDIVERRNEIAHGGLSNLLDITEFDDYIDFLELYVQSLAKILITKIQQTQFLYLKPSLLELTGLEEFKIFPGKIIGFNNKQKIDFTESDEILIEKGDGKIMRAKILNILKKQGYISLKLEVPSNLKSNQKFYLKPTLTSHKTKNLSDNCKFQIIDSNLIKNLLLRQRLQGQTISLIAF